jgi:hypothetical protein
MQMMKTQALALHPDAARLMNIPAAKSAAPWRHCEFCDCKTNAIERVCCPLGRGADRRNWDRSALA